MSRVGVVGILLVAAVVAGVVGTVPASAQGDNGAPEELVWLALGDSYASGEGLRYVDPGANPPDRNCERATGETTVNNGNGSRAYSKVAYDEVRGDWIGSHFELLACTGAISNQVHRQYREEWFDTDDRKADMVTVSMGGNNIGFADVIFGCAGVSFAEGFSAVAPALVGGSPLSDVPGLWALNPASGCTVSEDELRRRIDHLVADEGSGPFDTQTLPQMYRELEAEVMNDGGHVIVTGYPNLIGESGDWPLWLFEGDRCSRIRRADTAMLRSTTGYLNEQLAHMVNRLTASSSAGIEYHWVDVSEAYENDATGNHGLCTGDPWINGITIGWAGPDSERIPFRISRSFHPTQDGHDATGHAVAEVVRDLDWSRLDRQDDAPTYEQLLSAEIPGMCSHEPTTLMGGEDIEVDTFNGEFRLIETLESGTKGWATFNSADGPLTAVVAHCNAGGVGWPNPIMFFGPGPTFYDDVMAFEDYDWASIGLRFPARGAVESIRVDGSRLIVDVGMYTLEEDGCCHSGHATVALTARNGEVVVDEVLDHSRG